jgi:hypothetical protein
MDNFILHGTWRRGSHGMQGKKNSPALLTVICTPILVGHPSCLLHVIQDVAQVENVSQNGQILLILKELPSLGILIHRLRPLGHVASDFGPHVGCGLVENDVFSSLPHVVC